MSGKTVFISYRRDTAGRAFARSITQALTHQGYDVFLDVDSIDAGGWAEQIATEVPARAHFLLILTPGALDRCDDEADWVRREYEIAVRHGRNIVPVREESVDLAAARQAGPACMASVFDLAIAAVQHSSFDRDVEILIERYIPPHKAPEDLSGPPIAPTRLTHGAARLFGRDDEIARLDAAWADPETRLVTLVAWGGVGKTALVAQWAAQMAATDYDGARYFDWSFYSQGTRETGGPSSDNFIAAALRFFGDAEMADSPTSAWDKGARLAQLVSGRRTLLVLDGLEPLQHPPGPLTGQLKDPAITALLKGLAASNPGLCVVTTRESVTDLAPFRETTAPEWKLGRLSTTAGVELLRTLGVHGADTELVQLGRPRAHAQSAGSIPVQSPRW